MSLFDEEPEYHLDRYGRWRPKFTRIEKVGLVSWVLWVLWWLPSKHLNLLELIVAIVISTFLYFAALGLVFAVVTAIWAVVLKIADALGFIKPISTIKREPPVRPRSDPYRQNVDDSEDTYLF